jgi:hypothetical protein
VRFMRRALLALVLLLAMSWLAASAALAIWLPPDWRVYNWPLSVPGLAAMSPEGAILRWTPRDWRTLRLTGQNFMPRGSRLGLVTTVDAELALRGPLSLDMEGWRQGGGHVEVVGLSIVWGPLRFSGTGELRPSEDGALRGPLQGRLEGLEGATAMLSQTGILGDRSRIQGEVQLPLALFPDGRVMLGPLLLANWR